eukprot:CAMPEP_0176162682 /NCGR_PEP_ID=MMETSP0120_2-20121206/83229_1 /TAXON_ID=160619 /ORGANISM="Kryptoperidinium foliaceum, Strain CCMP 1326" /LENGTH=65 /DNA_ID=CAMNT_0017500191 /DNA_START=283 /DNA_END=480 /DNA_ORIENTATION=+
MRLQHASKLRTEHAPQPARLLCDDGRCAGRVVQERDAAERVADAEHVALLAVDLHRQGARLHHEE